MWVRSQAHQLLVFVEGMHEIVVKVTEHENRIKSQVELGQEKICNGHETKINFTRSQKVFDYN